MDITTKRERDFIELCNSIEETNEELCNTNLKLVAVVLPTRLYDDSIKACDGMFYFLARIPRSPEGPEPPEYYTIMGIKVETSDSIIEPQYVIERRIKNK